MQFYRRPLPIRAMSFDLDDTLYDNCPVIERLEQEMLVWLHNHHPLTATLPLSAWSKLKQDIVTENPALRHDVTLWRKTQIKYGLIQLGYTETKAEEASEAAIRRVLWLRNQVDVPDNTHNVMAELAANIPLVAITNGNVDPHKIGLGNYFQLILQAGPNGRSKPFADMFAQTAEFLAIPTAHILHIGDHLNTDVVGALAAGFQACWMNDRQRDITAEKHSRLLPHVEITRLEELLELIRPDNKNDVSA